MTQIELWPFDVEHVPTSGDFALHVLQKRGSRIDCGSVRLGDEVANFIRRAAVNTVAEIRKRVPVVYSPDMELEPDQCLLDADAELLDYCDLTDALLADVPVPALSSDELKEMRVWMYAAIFGSHGNRYAFVHRGLTDIHARRGGLLAIMLDRLDAVTEPILSLDRIFDFVAARSGVIALNQGAYDDVFTRGPTLTSHVKSWVNEIGGYLPLSEAAADFLASRGRSNKRVQGSLRRLTRGGQLSNLDIGKMRSYMREQDIEEGLYIQDGHIIVDSTNVDELLQILTESAYTGGMTGTRYVAQRKRPRPQQRGRRA